jgi:hypothetical protein
MRQFFDISHANSILAPLVRELPWTHNPLSLTPSKRDEERKFSVHSG